MVNSVAQFKQAAMALALRDSQLFAGLPSVNLNGVAEFTFVKLLEKDEFLFHEGEPAHGFYIVQWGAINLHRVNASGRERVIHIFRARESFAEGTLASDAGYPADARAVEPSQVLLVQKAGFLTLLRRHPELGLRVLGAVNLHLRILLGLLEELTMEDVETRLAHWLINRCPDRQSQRPLTIELNMTKRLLAAELGTVSETFSRTLAKFRRQHLLTVHGRSVTVLSPARLNALLRRQLGENP